MVGGSRYSRCSRCSTETYKSTCISESMFHTSKKRPSVNSNILPPTVHWNQNSIQNMVTLPSSITPASYFSSSLHRSTNLRGILKKATSPLQCLQVWPRASFKIRFNVKYQCRTWTFSNATNVFLCFVTFIFWNRTLASIPGRAFLPPTLCHTLCLLLLLLILFCCLVPALHAYSVTRLEPLLFHRGSH